MLPKFEDACLRMADEWTCIVQEAVLYNDMMDSGVDEEKVNKEAERMGRRNQALWVQDG